jgi:hypothetical protein
MQNPVEATYFQSPLTDSLKSVTFYSVKEHVPGPPSTFLYVLNASTVNSVTVAGYTVPVTSRKTTMAIHPSLRCLFEGVMDCHNRRKERMASVTRTPYDMPRKRRPISQQRSVSKVEAERWGMKLGSNSDVGSDILVASRVANAWRVMVTSCYL